MAMTPYPSTPPSPLRLDVVPAPDGDHTYWRLVGTFPTAIPFEELLSVLGRLSCWGGSRIELVLPAGDGPASWWDFWAEVIAQDPGPHLAVRFEDWQHHG